MEENEFERNEELEAVVKDLIDSEYELIYLKAGRVNVVVLTSDKCKKKDNIPVFADCEEVPEKFKWATTAQFMITIYMPNTAYFDEKRKRILLFQQLLKIIPTDKENEFKLRDYDLKDFSTIVDKYGTNWFREPTLFDDKD